MARPPHPKSDSPRRPQRAPSSDELARDIRAWMDRLQPLLPDIDPGDLLHIVHAVLRPIGSSGRRFLLRSTSQGSHAP